MNTSSRRVVVTGVGVVSCVGLGKDAFWNGILGPQPDTDRRAVADWDPSPWLDAKAAKRTDRFTQFAIAAAEMCMDDAGRPEVDVDRAGAFIATGIGGIGTLEEQIQIRLEKGERRVSPFLVPMMMPNAVAGNVSMRFGWCGPSETTVTACASSTHAIGNAAREIARGRVNYMLAGGAEASLTPTSIAGFRNMTALSTVGVSRPFDKDRDGFVIGEGAAVLMLEEYETAKARGAHIYAEILGAANTNDAYHITAPQPQGQGAVNCMKFALEDAGLQAGDIKHINAHGTSTPLNDAAEAQAVAQVFGTDIPTTSIKGITGHALGASGALEAVASVLSIEQELIPPTRGTVNLDPDVQLDVVLDEPRKWTPGPVISNSFGFGGHNGSVVFAPID